MPLSPDNTLLNGQYRILRQLGRGGFGFVYQAQDTLIHRDVAIKELIPALVGDEATLKRFLVEARATLELAHEQIVRTYNVFQQDGNYYIVMECMAGGSLEERLREGSALPVDEAVRIAAQVCAGLDHAHRRGIVHCDLKPANILFTSDGARSGIGTAKVADFGIAHVSGEMLTRSWMTPAGFVAGTLPYMSPEQADGVRDDPRVDVYAMGAVLYRMLTGRTYLDFDQRETPGAQADNVLRIRNAEPVPPSAGNRRVPAWLDGIVLKALSKRPEERYGSAAEMQIALEQREVAALVPPSVEAEPAPAPAQDRSRPHTSHRPAWFWPAVGAAGVLLIAIVVALALLLGGGTPPTDTPASEATQVVVVEPASPATLTSTPTSLPPTTTSTATGTPKPTHTLPPPTDTPTPTTTPVPPTVTSKPTNSPVPPTATPPRRSRIAFASSRDGNSEIYVMNADGSGQTNLTNNSAFDGAPAWSPDGTRIAFHSNRNGMQAIYVMNANGSGITRLTDKSAEAYNPKWSPDGKHIAFFSRRLSGYEYHICVMNADGSGEAQLTTGYANASDPAWSPDGQRIAFYSDRDGYEIYVANADGSGVTRLTYSQRNFYPAWSPDGKRILFVSDGYNNRAIYVMNADGSEQTNLTNNPAQYAFIVWSPDGTRIAFSSGRSGDEEIYAMNADGSAQTNLTNNPARDLGCSVPHRPCVMDEVGWLRRECGQRSRLPPCMGAGPCKAA